MHPRKIAAINAFLFFCFWSVTLLAGADFPPPVGFLLLVFVIAVCAFVVNWRVPTYIDWYRTKRPGRRWRVILDGVIAGIVVATPFVLNRSGAPSITPRSIDYAIWFALLGFVGALNSVAIYFVNTVFIRMMDSGK